jgi:hypothetical protein
LLFLLLQSPLESTTKYLHLWRIRLDFSEGENMTTSNMDKLGHALEETKGFVEQHAWQAAVAVEAWPISREVAKLVEPDKSSASHKAKPQESSGSNQAMNIAEAAALAAAAKPPVSPGDHSVKTAHHPVTQHSVPKAGGDGKPATEAQNPGTAAGTAHEAKHVVNKDGSGAVPKPATDKVHPASTKPNALLENEPKILAAAAVLPKMTIEGSSKH